MKRYAITLSIALVCSASVVLAQPQPEPVVQPTAVQVPTQVVVQTPTSTSVAIAGLSPSLQVVSVLPSPEKTPEAEAQLAEDLNVMGAVVDRLLHDAGIRAQSWRFASPSWRLDFGRAQRSARSLYIPKFGVLIFLQLDFPLAAPAENEEASEAGSHDALWSQVQQSMHGSARSSGYASADAMPLYDELKVENLRRTILRALPYARNIRGLASEESITVVASHSSDDPVMQLLTLPGTNVASSGRAASAQSRMRILSFQTTKADIDALGAGQIDTEAFQQRVRSLNYAVPQLAGKQYR